MAYSIFIYTGRGYLRFAELTAFVNYQLGSGEVRIYRGGPGRVCISVGTAGKADQTEIDRIAEQVRGQVVVFCQAAIQDFGIDLIETFAEDGSQKRTGFMRTLKGSQDFTVHVPFQNHLDLPSDEVKTLAEIIASSIGIRPNLVTEIEHSLTQAEENVEAFLANYAVLESVLGGKQSDVDSFIRRVEPT